jgi:hypothetical protein
MINMKATKARVWAHVGFKFLLEVRLDANLKAIHRRNE